jgi:hypothetical protein
VGRRIPDHDADGLAQLAPIPGDRQRTVGIGIGIAGVHVDRAARSVHASLAHGLVGESQQVHRTAVHRAFVAEFG